MARIFKTRKQDSPSAECVDFIPGQNAHEQQGDDPTEVPLDDQAAVTAAEPARENINAKTGNPLTGFGLETLEDMGARYARRYGMSEEGDIRAFQKGACLAQDPTNYRRVPGLTGGELEILGNEFENRWSQPKLMYAVIVLCSICAAVQGMGE